jgi:DeoR family ulaG and ulaABCDEF operon transcriptional repressor
MSEIFHSGNRYAPTMPRPSSSRTSAARRTRQPANARQTGAKLHATEREQAITALLEAQGFVAFRDLTQQLQASPASVRRDLTRLHERGILERVHGGARLSGPAVPALSGVPFQVNAGLHALAKAAIGKAAAELCAPGEAVIIDGGSTTLQLCPHIAELGLQVLTNSLHIVQALLPQVKTRISLPGGALFREQNIILSPYEDDSMAGALGGFHASKLFLGAAAVGRRGPMQSDTLLIQAERRLLKRAEQIILMVDSSKFAGAAGHLLCPLEDLDVLVTDAGLQDGHARMVERAGVKLVIA